MKFFNLTTILLASVILMVACSSENDLAPGVNEVHIANWVASHGIEANTDLTGCQICHGLDFNGNGNAVSCFTCHADGPPFISHPASWVDVEQDHQTFFTDQSWTQCANAACHGTDLQGGDFGPSCFLAACHTDGPPAPHVASYRAASAHGPDAKSAQLECRNCHGRPENIFDGGFVADILGLTGADAGNCSTSSCHPEARAHPVNWQGDNDTGAGYVSSHQGEFNTACALCHKTDGPGSGPLPPAPSCYIASYENSDPATALFACHIGGPGVPHIIGADWLLRSEHAVTSIADSSYCLGCHEVSSGGISPTCRSCHTQDNPVTNSTGCDSCHGNPPNTGRHTIGEHSGFSCNNCHLGFGTETLGHWYPDPTSPADTNSSTGIIFNKDTNGSVISCSGSCHGDGHDNESW